MKLNRHGSAASTATRKMPVGLLGAALALLTAAGLVLGSGFRSLPGPNGTERGSVSTLDAAGSAQRAQVLSSISQLPLMFEPNVGQADARAKFVARGAGYGLLLTSEGATISLGHRGRSEFMTMKLAGANTTPVIAGADALPGHTSYFLGNDPARWHRDVPQFSRVRYENVYPGINVAFYGNQRQLEYDFQVAPGADPSQAQLQFDAAKSLELSEGDVIVHGDAGMVRLQAPRVYQQVEGRLVPVDARFVLRAENRVAFQLGAYDRSRELIIDPILSYSTFFGGSGNDTSPSIAVDNVGNIYMAGSTTSADLPAGTGSLVGAQNVFVLKLNPQAGAGGVVYLTYLGGGGIDSAVGIGVDGAGNAYIAGNTTSGLNGTAAFPTTGTNAYQTGPASGSAGTQHVFVSAIDPTGTTLKYSSYLSGNGTDSASGMTKDNKGNVYITGTTTSNDAGSVSDQFPVSSLPQGLPFQDVPRAPVQFFVTKVNTAAFGVGSIAYSTYFGGGVPSTGVALGGGIVVDGTGNVYFNGTTNFIFTGTSPSTDFPILNAYQACLDVPTPNTVTGPVTCASTSATNNDGFVAKLNPAAAPGSQLIWSTYLGGSGTDSARALTIDSGGASVYVTGNTDSTDFTIPTAIAAYQATNAGGTDAFVGRLSNPTTGNVSLTYFTYLGGTGTESANAIAVDTANGALVTGSTTSADFPIFPNTASNPLCTVQNPCVLQGSLSGSQDAFFARINTGATTGQNTVGNYATYFGGTGVDRGTSITLDSNLNTYFAGDTTSTSPSFQTAIPLQLQNNGGTDTFAVRLGTAADLAITGKLSLATGQNFIAAGNPATFNYTITNNGPDVATNITVTANLSNTVTGVPVTFKSASGCSSTTGSVNVVCAIAPLQSGSTATVSIVVTPTAAGNFNGGAVSVSSSNNNDPNPGNNSVTVPAQATDFTVSISPSNVTIPAAGDTATYTVTLTPVPSFSANVTLTASGLPNASGASFSSSSVSLSNGPATSTLKIATTARPITTGKLQSPRGVFYALGFLIPGIAMMGLGKSRRSKRILGLLLIALLFGLILLQPACSGSSTTPPTVSGTQPGTTTMTLTAAGGISHNATFSITVP